MADAELSVTEVARILGFSQTTALRILKTPEEFVVDSYRCRGCGGKVATAACRVCRMERQSGRTKTPYRGW